MGRFAFAAKSISKSITQRSDCPFCGNNTTTFMERKHVILQLRRCERCKLQFRFPKDNSAENKSFYQTGYRQSTVTDLPAPSELPSHIADDFKEIGRDISEHLKTIKAIVPDGKLLDYGSSWGYCVYQFRKAGYDASGFEVSTPRVEFGREMLGVNLSDSIASYPDASFDVIYSAHCLEHIPDPDTSLSQFKRLLKPGGHLFIYVPNCGGAEAKKLGVHWGPMIGEKHVLALTADFLYANLPKYGFQLEFASSPYSAPPEHYETAALDGEELLVVGVRDR